MLFEAYGRETMQKSIASERHKWFKDDHKNVDDERSGNPRSQRTDEIV
jgi:hypothetical protein